MKREIVSLRIFRYYGKPIQAKREVPFEIRLQARMNLDVVCYKYNRSKLEEAINKSLKENDKETFEKLSERFKQF